MAGVPSVFEAMLHNVIPTLETGKKLLSESVDCPFGEGVIGIPLSAIQEKHADTIIGSYPSFRNGSFSTQLVVRGHQLSDIKAAVQDIEQMLADLIAKQAQ